MFSYVYMDVCCEFLYVQLCTFIYMHLLMCVYIYLHICMYVCTYVRTRAVWKVCGLAAVRRCYAEGGGDSYMPSCSGGGNVVVA
jgi:hypothetical protein